MNDQAGAQRKRLSKTSALDPATGKFKKAQSAFSVAEDLLAQSEEWHRALIETASRAGLGIVVWQDTPDREAAVVFANDEFCRMLGYSREELFNMLISEYVRESDLEKSLATYRRRQQGENVVSLHEATYVRKDGTLLTAENSVALMRYQGKTATVAFVTDISERKMAEQELTKHRHQLEAIVQERTAELRRGYEILEREISEKEKVEEALRLSERYFRSLTEKAFDAILIVTADGTIRYASPSIEHVFGLNKDEIIGVRSLGYVHPDDRKRIAGIFMGLLHTHGAIEQVELRGHHADGSWRVFDAVYTNLLNDPVIAGITVNFRDVTERKEAQEQLQSLYKQERELRQRIEVEMKRRVEFTRALAHELKTPLTSVLASSDLLLARLQDEPSLGLARNINYAASNLNTRINELLDLVKSEVGILQLKLETIDSLQVLRDVVRSMTPLALRQGQSLTLDLPPSIPVLRADRTRFQQIVANLLSNAIKFTPDGGKISVRAKAKNSSLIVEISDTGPGISSKDQQRLFKPYQRLDGGTGNLGGLGIGLSLCKTLVELHDGQIWVRSRLGKGSVFGFSLPLNPDNRSVTESEREVKPWKALIIEDDAAIVDSLVLALDIEWPEVQVISTRSGEEGVDLIEVEDPDVVLLDLGLPDVSGFEVLRQIRLFSAVPIIILTVSSEEADMVKGLEWGADDYVVKPFRPKELIARMRSQLRKQTPPDEEAPIVSGPLRFDPSTCQLTIAGNEVSLTTIEGRIVENLMKNAGHVVTYSRLAEAVWDEDYPGSLETLRVHIRHLRAKVESDPGNPKIVLTKPGIGYLLARPS